MFIKCIHDDQSGSRILFSVKMNTNLSMLLSSLMIVNILVLTKVKTTKLAVLLMLYKLYMSEGNFHKLAGYLDTKVLPIFQYDENYFTQGKIETLEN
jgi:hypothetical protein